MIRIKKLPLVAGIAAALVLGVVVTGVANRLQHRSRQGVVYYCPMHPTYTADRPGDCPICNMTLVKRDEPSSSSPAGPARPLSAKDICYMHNCPMMKPGQTCPMMVMAKAGEPVTCPICGTHVAEAATIPSGADPEARRILYWTDPMLPGFKSDAPGKSPMGMDLIPVYQERGASGAEQPPSAPEGYAPILVTPHKRQFIGVTTAPVERRTISRMIRTVGQIANDPELYQAQQEYLQAAKALEQAKTGTNPEVVERAARLVDSSRVRLRRLGLSDELIDEVATWQGPDQSLILADPSGRVWVYAPIYEYELPYVKAGQTISVEVAAIPGKTLEGVIKAVDPVLDPATRSARIRAILTDPEQTLRPEMFVNVTIAVAARDALTVPQEAVFNTGTKRIVFVDKGRGIFEPRDVAVGGTAGEYYEVTSGLAEGELVVTSGNFLIDSESRLKAALEGMADSTGSGQAGGGHQHGGQ
jgi:hypothetical protein